MGRISRTIPLYAIIAIIVVSAALLALIGGAVGFTLLRANRLQSLTPTVLQSLIPTPLQTPTPDSPFVCDQPAMAVITRTIVTPPFPKGDVPLTAPEPTTDPASHTHIPPNTIQSIAFLDLPFPYDGGNQNFGGTAEQFRRANQRTVSGGRVNSFFDHLYPLYPAPQNSSASWGREPAAPPYGGSMLLFDGAVSDYDYYSGHPGYDYTPFVRRQPTTPLFAAADGVIDSAGEHSSGALFVRVRHTVPGVGVFRTTYWHLHPDEYYYAMLGRAGEPITAGTRLGTMGNTGWSTGHHLHFEVRFDRNNDGSFTLDEVVDPYGFIPSAQYPADPWAQPVSFTDAQGQQYNHTASLSHYLWIYPLGASAVVPAEGGGQLNQPGGVGGADAGFLASLCAKRGSLPPGGTVNYSWAPDPPPSETLAGAGQGCVLSAFDPQGNPVTRFDPPLAVQLPLDPAGLADLDPETMAIHWQETGSSEWMPLPTQIDPQRQLALAYTDRPGRCALLGRPTRDLMQPKTTIQVSGPTSADGDFYQAVSITLSSADPSGITRIEYSLDAGSSWQVYTSPITLKANGIPDRPPQESVGDAFGSGPGRFLVLASATAGAGHAEGPARPPGHPP